jgi:bacterioferritin
VSVQTLHFSVGMTKSISQNPGSQMPFSKSVQEIRDRAREHIKQGAITPSYKGNIETSIKVLNEALATELVCVLRYKYHYFAAEGLHAKSIAEEFLEHAQEEQEHADKIARRIRQLGGKADLNPQTLLERSHSEYQEGNSLIEMIEEDLIAERIAIDSYREMILYFGDDDSTSKMLMEEILAKEEEHAEELSSLLIVLDPTRAAEAA